MPSDLGLIIEQVAVLFVIIMIGLILNRRKIINEAVEKGLSDLLIYVTLPALIISSMIGEAPDIWIEVGIVFVLSFLTYVLVIFLAELIGRFYSLTEERKGVFKFEVVFANVGYMGYPVVLALFPEGYIIYAVIFNFMFDFLVWTYGIYVFESSNHQFSVKSFLNPGIIALSIGLFFFISGINLPAVISESLDLVGGMTSPLAMIVIGSTLASAEGISYFKDKDLFWLTLLRLIAIPLIIFAATFYLPVSSSILGVIFILWAMPAAANSVIWAEMFGENDVKFASKGVILTTFFSLFTLPFLIFIFNLFL